MKQIIPVFFLLITLFSFGQRQNFNSLSIEQGIGFHVPLLPADNISQTKYINFFNHFHVGARYMVFRDLGVRVQYLYNRFQNQDDASMGTTFNRIIVEAVYNLRNLFSFLENFENLGFLVHGGLGYTSNNSLSTNLRNKMGNIQFGGMAIIRLSKNAALFADGTIVGNVNQHIHFNGILYNDLGHGDNTGVFGTLSFGVIVYLGEKNKFFEHADWEF